MDYKMIITALRPDGTAVKVKIGSPSERRLYDKHGNPVDYAKLSPEGANKLAEYEDDLYDLPTFKDDKISVGLKGLSVFYAEQDAEYIGEEQ